MELALEYRTWDARDSTALEFSAAGAENPSVLSPEHLNKTSRLVSPPRPRAGLIANRRPLCSGVREGIMDPAGLRSPSEAGLRDLRALCLSMAATGSHRVGAGLAYAVTATLVAVATGVPCGSG